VVFWPGFEFANLQAGIDYKLMRNLGIGPFVSFSLGEFNATSANNGGIQGVPGANNITDKTLHEWLTIGVKGAFAI
jgi:hypothetical protein